MSKDAYNFTVYPGRGEQERLDKEACRGEAAHEHNMGLMGQMGLVGPVSRVWAAAGRPCITSKPAEHEGARA